MNEHILAAAVVEQAADDWRRAIRPTNTKSKNFKKTVRAKRERIGELRRFFRGKSADLYSGGNGKAILSRLEEEYAASKGRLQIEAYERGEIG